MLAVQGKNSDGAGVVGIKAGETVGDFFGCLILFNMEDLAADGKNLLSEGKIEIFVKLGTGPYLACFYAAVSFFYTLVLRGENC